MCSSLADSYDFDITGFPSGPGAPAAPGSPWAPCVNKPACQFYHSLRQQSARASTVTLIQKILHLCSDYMARK